MNSPRIPTSPARRSFANFVPVALFTLLLSMGLLKPAFAQTAPPLGTAQNFAVLGSSTVTNSGSSVVTGDLGVSPGTAVTGFPPGIVDGGSIYAADTVSQQARTDATTAYGDLAGQVCNTTYSVPTDLGGKTLVPGVYCFASSAAITGTLTLNGGGDPTAAFIFRVGSTLITASAASVVLINGAQRCEVFWQVGTSATIGTGTSFIGTVIALSSITLDTGATMSGRALARNGAVTLDSNTVSVTSCAVPVNAPVISKSFKKPSIIAGGDSILTLTLSNPNSTAANITSPLTDTFPSGVFVSGNASTTCGGTVSAPIGLSAVSLTGGAIPANGSCTVTVAVTAPAAGTYINSVHAGALKTSNGNNAAPAVATLTVTPVISPVLVPPTLGKSFSPATIAVDGVSILVLTLSNSNPVIDTMTAPLTDHLPAGLTVDGTASTTCGGVADAPKGSTAVTLTGGIIPAKGSCTVSVGVTSDSAGSYYNSVGVGALKTDNGNNAAPAVATLTVTSVTVLVPPTLAKSFNPATISVDGVSTLVFKLSNSNPVIDTMTAPLTDHLPAGLTVDGVASTTCGGVVDAPQGGTAVTLTGGAIPAKGSCTVSVKVTPDCECSYYNSIGAGALKTNNGNNAAPALATLTATKAILGGTPTLGKFFYPETIKPGGSTTLTITLTNTDATAATLTAPLTDLLPGGMVVYGVPTNVPDNTCGGTLSAVKGNVHITLTGGTIPANGSCRIVVYVAVKNAGTYVNSLLAGTLRTSNGSNKLAASATLFVSVSAGGGPTLRKSFSPATIKNDGISTLTITLTNPYATAATLKAPLNDYMPTDMVVYGSAGNTCGGVVKANPGTSIVTLTGGAIPAHGSCTVTVLVTAPCNNYFNNLPAGALQTSNGNSQEPTGASLTVTPD